MEQPAARRICLELGQKKQLSLAEGTSLVLASGAQAVQFDVSCQQGGLCRHYAFID